MLQFRARRTRGTLFDTSDTSDTREAFLTAAVDYPGISPKWICHAVEHANGPFVQKGHERAGAPNATPDDLEAGRMYGFPWITLVLGSGCLDARDTPAGQDLHAFPAAVEEQLRSRPQLLDGTPPSMLARTFAESLIEDRVGPPRKTEFSEATGNSLPTPTVSKHAAKLVLAATLATLFYHTLKCSKPVAMTRLGNDQATLNWDSQSAPEDIAQVLEPLNKLLDELQTEQPSAGILLSKLITEVRQALSTDGNKPRITSTHLALLTELAWYYLTKDTAVYPGWSELLLDLSMRQESNSTKNPHPRPIVIDVSVMPHLVMERLDEVTEKSWQSFETTSPESAATPRDRLYSAAASVIREQALLRNRMKPTLKPPIASAFVTSFDLELEMAMWATANDLEPFIVAMPVNLLVGHENDQNRTASTCWLGCLIQPTHDIPHHEQLQQLRSPSDWFLLSNDHRYGTGKRAVLPIIVRLNGCPLIELPPLRTKDGELTDLCVRMLTIATGQVPPRLPIHIEHAVLVDEYAALQQVAVEMFNFTPNTETDDALRYCLPDVITGSNQPNIFTRYWMVMGVQMGDTGVRYRFASQMTSPMKSSGDESLAPLSSGVAINRRLDSAVGDLLHWYGFDVVLGDCEDYTEDLEHYVKHLQNPQRRSRSGKGCDLK